VTQPWLSIITVVKDDLPGLTRTLDSIHSQELEGVEIVIIDSSEDHSEVEAIALSSSASATYFWTPPQGIYPAMNLGLARARGDHVYFLNARDVLFRNSVLSSARPLISKANWAIGPVEIIETNGRRVFTPAWNYERERQSHFSRGFFPAHQGTFVRRELALQMNGFDTQFGVAADYAMALALSQVSNPAQLPFVIASFYEGGTSTQKWSQAVAEFHRARRSVFDLRGRARVVEGFNTVKHWSASWFTRELRPSVTRGRS
jgi:putative colanic acid biosynthesis glycosyltransferase